MYDGPDNDYSGQEVCLTSDEQSVGIVDVSNKNNPTQISRFTYPSVGYTHQGWLTEDKNYFLVNDEFDEVDEVHDTRTYVFDVKDLDFPMQIGAIDNPRDAVGHNFYVQGNLLYQANYSSGLRIMNLDRIANAFAIEEAYYDTYPDDDTRDNRPAADGPGTARGAKGDTIFQGAWSNYPYFASGTIVVSDIDRGLFVLKATNP
jgi:choice-of-anchor B domain-containing protein